MPVKILSKTRRGCGTRKVGGTYLFFAASVVQFCHRLPFGIPDACPCCGEHLRQIRSVQVIDPKKLFRDAEDTLCSNACPICHPPTHGGIMWVGKKYYTPLQFSEEAHKYGISKRIGNVPKGIVKGDLIFFAHPEAVEVQTETGQSHLDGTPEVTKIHLPGVFLAARLTEIQRVITEEQANDEELIRDLEERGIQPVIESDAITDDGILNTLCDQEGDTVT